MIYIAFLLFLMLIFGMIFCTYLLWLTDRYERSRLGIQPKPIKSKLQEYVDKVTNNDLKPGVIKRPSATKLHDKYDDPKKKAGREAMKQTLKELQDKGEL